MYDTIDPSDVRKGILLSQHEERLYQREMGLEPPAPPEWDKGLSRHEASLEPDQE